jgi:hypothetical protein
VAREDLHGAGGLGCEQDVTGQVEQASDLIAAGDCLARAIVCRRRQVAGDDGDDQECKQRNPVLGVNDGERAGRSKFEPGSNFRV